jgi:hypothetical protein
MPSILSTIVIIAFGVLWTLAVASWVAVVVYGVKALREPRPGVRLCSRATLWNPANALIRAELLTEQGRRYRAKCLRALLLFGACVGGGLLIGSLTGTLK